VCGRRPVSGLQADARAFPHQHPWTPAQWLLRACRDGSRRLLTVAGAAQVRHTELSRGGLLFPVSSQACACDTDKRAQSNACTYHPRCFARVRCYDFGMLEELEALSTKLAELASHVRALKDENNRLRAQGAAATAELAGLRAKVTAATQRMDALLARLPQEDEPLDVKAK
jgi:uncharacterized protein (TIGR02449 family)